MQQQTFHLSIFLTIATPVLLSLSGCATICPAAYSKYPANTPEGLIDSYLRAHNRSYDEAIYYFSTPLAEQNKTDRDVYIKAGEDTCRWTVESWRIEAVEYSRDEKQAVVLVSVVVAWESEVTNDTLRFECMREGKRWLVLKREWAKGDVQ